MYIDKYLPFLRKSPVIGKRRGEIKTEHLFFPYEVKNFETVNATSDSARKYMLNRVPKVYHVKPLDLLVMDEPFLYVQWYRSNVEEVECEIVELDYNKVARFVEIEDVEREDTLYLAMYPLSNGYQEQEIVDPDLVVAAANGISLNKDSENVYSIDTYTLPSINSLEESNKMIYEINQDLLKAVSSGEGLGTDVSQDSTPIESRLESYLRAGYVTERVPVLMGPTAVAKSATVKAVCEKLGFRMVDLRVAFMSRLDFEGLSEKVTIGDKVESYNAAMLPIVECTDDFLNFCRAAIPKIEKAIEEAEKENAPKEEIDQLNKMLDYYKDKARTPVLFFDEITRTEASVRNALTKILNEKEFLGYEMTQARIVAATNVPIGLPEDLNDLYLSQDVQDVATLDRFEPLKVYPEDVRDRWIAWASKVENGKQNIHQVILSFLEEYPEYYYNYDEVIQVYEETDDFDDLSTTAFPNYRTWEMFSDYLTKCEELDNPVSINVIKGLVGSAVVPELTSFLRKKGYEVKETEPSDELDDIVEQGMLANVPTLLIGPSSLGKTTRIKNAAKEKLGVRDENFIQINLAMQDRVDIMGPPVKVDLAAYIGGLGANAEETEASDRVLELTNELSSLVKSFDLPPKVTIKAPKTSIAQRLREAQENNEPVVLFFDEMNRVNNEAVMTAIFEAISDNRIFGVEFDPKLVRIFGAANLGENTEDARSLDPAFSARFNIHRRKGYQLSDVDSFLKYIEEKNYNPFIIEYFKNMEKEEVLEIIKSVENRQIDEAVPSMRAISDLNKALNDENGSPELRGTILFADKSVKTNLEKLLISSSIDHYTKNLLKNVCSSIRDKLDNWSAKNMSYKPIGPDGTVYPLEDLIELFEYLYDQIFVKNAMTSEQDYLSLKNTLVELYDIDSKVASKREAHLSFIIGSEAAKFTSYYNTVSGTESVNIEISDLKDKSLIVKFFDQKLSSMSDPTDIINALCAYYTEFSSYFGDSLSRDHYQEFVRRSLDVLSMPSQKAILLKKVSTSPKADKVFSFAEKDDNEFIKEVFRAAGLPISDEAIERAKSYIGNTQKPKLIVGGN